MNRPWSKMILLFLTASMQPSILAEKTCTFSSYQWNIHLKKAVGFKQHRIPYKSLTKSQRTPSGCTICIEDQVILEYPGLKPFRICHVFADAVKAELAKLFKSKVKISSIEAYRVGKTRGNPDENGNRTQYSNHSFGIAIDFNANSNGLYTNCIVFTDNCRLIKGGPWHPQKQESLHANHPIVQAMKSIGFKWGGEIIGKQKDFMHFSPSGY